MPDFEKLKKGWEFDLIFRTGIRVNGDLVRLLYLQENDGGIKFACTVAKRFAKAHQRNRGRRIMREAFRQLSKNHKIIPNIKIILSLREKGLEAKTQEIYNELEKLFTRKKLIQKKCSHLQKSP